MDGVPPLVQVFLSVPRHRGSCSPFVPHCYSSLRVPGYDLSLVPVGLGLHHPFHLHLRAMACSIHYNSGYWARLLPLTRFPRHRSCVPQRVLPLPVLPIVSNPVLRSSPLCPPQLTYCAWFLPSFGVSSQHFPILALYERQYSGPLCREPYAPLPLIPGYVQPRRPLHFLGRSTYCPYPGRVASCCQLLGFHHLVLAC